MRPHHVRPGMRVIVRTGTINEQVNDQPPIVAVADVLEPADGMDRWWLHVYFGPPAHGIRPLPQQYHASEIVGIPAHGLTMPGLPLEGADHAT